MSKLSQMDREVLRRQMLKFLAERFRLLLDVKAIASMMKARRYIDFEIEQEDVDQSLALLTGMGLVVEKPDPFGATKYYQVTAEGMLESERL